MTIFIPRKHAPPVGPSYQFPELDPAGNGNELLRICTFFDDYALSGNQLRNIADAASPAVIGGTAYTANPLRTNTYIGRCIEIHPSGGIYGIDNPLYNDIASSGDITMLWFGEIRNTGSAHGAFGWRGSGGDSFRVGFNGSDLRVSYIDNSPAQFNADVTVSPSVGDVYCFVGRKKGNTITAFAKKFGAGIQSSSTTAGNGTFRDDGAGNKISPANTDAGKGHTQPAVFCAWDGALSDALIDQLMTNPRQGIKPRKTYFMLPSAVASGPTLALQGFPA